MNIAIKGYSTRGKEVIEILEMLGGKNIHNSWGVFENRIYTIDEKTYEIIDVSERHYSDYILFTLEEFLEKFPYKVGDKVRTIYGKIGIISKPIWSNRDECIRYELEADTDSFYFVNELQPYKEENMDERKYADLRLDVDQDDKLATEATIDGDKITPPENYLIGKITKVDNGMLVEFVKKRPQLPKTYEECCKVLGIDSDNYLSIRNLYRDDGDEEKTDYESDLLDKFDHLWELTICRDTYWKIAGEQMGLESPWVPDWLDTNTQKYCIYYVGVEIKKQPMLEVHHFLAFPTKEMSDAFFENFKELIEACKDFL